ncbi:MAG: lysozyme [Sphingobacteriaceae bacterium]
MEIKKVSTGGIKFLIHEEGLRLKPYLCGGGVPTIGVGCTFYPDGRKVKLSDPTISEEQAIAMFQSVLTHFERKVSALTRDDINQNQFDALVSLCFNIGTAGFEKSTLLRLVNSNPSDPAIQQAFEAWKNASGKPILLDRRKREYRLYTKAV